MERSSTLIHRNKVLNLREEAAVPPEGEGATELSGPQPLRLDSILKQAAADGTLIFGRVRLNRATAIDTSQEAHPDHPLNLSFSNLLIVPLAERGGGELKD